jgi:hypothetical protein
MRSVNTNSNICLKVIFFNGFCPLPACLTLRYVPPKRRWTSTGLHVVTSKKRDSSTLQKSYYVIQINVSSSNIASSIVRLQTVAVLYIVDIFTQARSICCFCSKADIYWTLDPGSSVLHPQQNLILHYSCKFVSSCASIIFDTKLCSNVEIDFLLQYPRINQNKILNFRKSWK